jgi:PAS domain S-box-containing protein
MAHDPALLDELKRLRVRVRELEEQLTSEGDLAPAGDLSIAALKSLVFDAGIFVAVYNRQGDFLFLNRTDSRHKPEDLIGESLFTLTKPEYHPLFRTALHRVFEEGCLTQVEAEGTRGGWYCNRLGPVKVGGRVVAVSNFCEDITCRRETEHQLRESEARWRSLAEGVPDVVMVTDMQGRIQSVNRLRTLTHEQLRGTPVVELSMPEHRPAIEQALVHVRQSGQTVEVEAQDQIEHRWYLARIAPLWGDQEILGTVLVARDISDRRQREEAVREREAKLRFLIDNMPVITWSVDQNLCFTSFRGRGLRALGLEPEETVGRSAYEYFRVLRDESEPIASHRRALAGESVTLEHNWSGRRYHALIEPLRNEKGEPVGAVAVAVDITERWAVERQVRSELERCVAERTEELESANQALLKERIVLQRLLDLHDRDRQLISYEIHDGIVQDMTAALMFFDSSAEAALEKGGRAAQGHRHGSQLLRATIQEARRLINGLRPPVLDEFGLLEAIANLIGEIEGKMNISIHFERDVEFDRLAPVVETAVYRIVQESLNNIWQHSQAARASVFMQQQGQNIHITVQDWGRGFDLSCVKPKRFGLLSIRDRSRLMGGEASITSAVDEGTVVKVTLPISDVLLPSALPKGSK